MSSGDSPLAPPRGMRDFYPDDMAMRNAIVAAWVAAARRFGFSQYDACVVESLDLLKRKAGEEIVDQIYTFTDKSGRELALRPEMTPSLARMVAARFGSLAFPLKWFAVAQCFRYERMSRGRKREHYQWNLDVIGENSVSAEAEVIATAAQALALLGLDARHYRVHFNSRALLSELLTRLGIPAEQHARTFLALDKRGKLPDDEIRASLVQSGLQGPDVERIFSLLNITSLEQVAETLGPSSESMAAIARFLQFVETQGIRDLLTFDISVIRGLSYYTGIVFEAFDVQRQFRAIFGGGRYDNLLADIGGKPSPGVGLGFGDVVVAEILAGQPPAAAVGSKDVVAIGFMEASQHLPALSLAVALRKAGRDTDMALHAEKAKAFFSRVGNAGFGEAIYIGPDDLSRGTVRIKTLATRTEREVPLADLLAGQQLR